MVKSIALLCLVVLFSQCSNKETVVDPYAAIKAKFPTTINATSLADYTGQGRPTYITKDNTGTNSISNAGATLGRVLFYDKNLSSSNTIACASCHKQSNAFSDTPVQSQGVNGVTGRHAMRLVNSRFSTETKFFWDERAATLEAQTTRPIQDHKEMGFSGADGDQNLAALITKLQSIDYYKDLFTLAYGNNTITEARMQNAMAQFIRSIQSFDSKYDAGRATAPNDGGPFSNFSTLENQGKNLFLAPPVFDANGIRVSGGAGCQGCHQAPEFDIAPNSGNN
ncbi:MAG TPA: cytochrome-c peroxidase, partial [Cyclobacteriaceae bacterium]|nr:cytochrome-c peroxidase [Cyclobacteriaceae bacterium]